MRSLSVQHYFLVVILSYQEVLLTFALMDIDWCIVMFFNSSTIAISWVEMTFDAEGQMLTLGS